jgi:hypothetical protein
VGVLVNALRPPRRADPRTKARRDRRGGDLGGEWPLRYHKVEFSNIVEFLSRRIRVRQGYRAGTVKRGDLMREVILLAPTTGLALMAVLVGKTSGNDWRSVVISLLFAGWAGVLLAMLMS